MCIIVTKESGQHMPTWGMLFNAWNRNPHGAGFLHHPKGGEAYVQKGFMSWKKFRDTLVQADIQTADFVAIHFRWATSGARDGGACHPFPLSKDLTVLRKRNIEDRTVMFHNGVIGPGTKSWSDTMLLAGSLRGVKFKVLDKHAEEILKPEVAGNRNRFLFYDMENGKVRYVGKWVTIGGYKCSKQLPILPRPKYKVKAKVKKVVEDDFQPRLKDYVAQTGGSYRVNSRGEVVGWESNSPDRYDWRAPQGTEGSRW